MILVAAAGAESRPDYNASRAFGFELQQDFAKRHSAAVLERLDETALRKRAFAAYSDEVALSAQTDETWQNFYTGFLTQLKGLDACEQMSFARVLSLNGARMLECELFSRNGGVQQIYWELAAGADGKIHIVDQRLMGESLSYMKRIKDLMLLLGARSMVKIDDEEMDLEQASLQHRTWATEALQAMGRGELDLAFREWSGLPDEVKNTAIWRDIRMSIAARGDQLANASIREDIQAGKPGINAMVRYNAAMFAGDYAAALQAIDGALAETYDAPLYQAMKCDLLVKTHRAKEGLQLATATYRLNPYSFNAYLQGATAAVALDDFRAAMEALRAWSQVYAPALIDAVLKGQPTLEKLRASPAYQEWLKAAKPASGL